VITFLIPIFYLLCIELTRQRGGERGKRGKENASSVKGLPLLSCEGKREKKKGEKSA